MKSRAGTVKLRIETDRWCALNRDEQICKNGVEDVEHFLLHCTCMVEERMELEEVDE